MKTKLIVVKGFLELYKNKCKSWITALNTWQGKPGTLQNVETGGIAMYACLREHTCKGLGDRLAGVTGTLSYAINRKRPFRIGWEGLHDIFTSCVLTGVNGQWYGGVTKEWIKTLKREHLVDHCEPESKTQCKDLFHISCKNNRDQYAYSKTGVVINC